MRFDSSGLILNKLLHTTSSTIYGLSLANVGLFLRNFTSHKLNSSVNMASWQRHLVNFAMRRLKNRATNLIDDIPRLRLEKEAILGKLFLPSGLSYKRFTLGQMEAEWIVPSRRHHREKVILYLHGGGYAIGSIKSYRSLIAKIAKTTGIRTLAINYRLAPEHPFPAALDDAVEAYRFLLEEELFQPEDIIIAGDSAGGGLSVSTLLALRDSGLPQPLAAVLLSPWTDLAATGRSYKLRADQDPILPACKIKIFGTNYAGAHPVKSPLISPLYGNLEGLAPMLIQVGTEEIVFDDSTRLAKKAKEAGTSVKLEVWDKMPHVWHFSWHVLPEARRAIDGIASWLKHRIHEHDLAKAHLEV